MYTCRVYTESIQLFLIRMHRVGYYHINVTYPLSYLFKINDG
jgi:hypothetical protein